MQRFKRKRPARKKMHLVSQTSPKVKDTTNGGAFQLSVCNHSDTLQLKDATRKKSRLSSNNSGGTKIGDKANIGDRAGSVQRRDQTLPVTAERPAVKKGQAVKNSRQNAVRKGSKVSDVATEERSADVLSEAAHEGRLGQSLDKKGSSNKEERCKDTALDRHTSVSACGNLDDEELPDLIAWDSENRETFLTSSIEGGTVKSPLPKDYESPPYLSPSPLKEVLPKTDNAAVSPLRDVDEEYLPDIITTDSQQHSGLQNRCIRERKAKSSTLKRQRPTSCLSPQDSGQKKVKASVLRHTCSSEGELPDLHSLDADKQPTSENGSALEGNSRDSVCEHAASESCENVARCTKKTVKPTFQKRDNSHDQGKSEPNHSASPPIVKPPPTVRSLQLLDIDFGAPSNLCSIKVTGRKKDFATAVSILRGTDNTVSTHGKKSGGVKNSTVSPYPTMDKSKDTLCVSPSSSPVISPSSVKHKEPVSSKAAQRLAGQAASKGKAHSSKDKVHRFSPTKSGGQESTLASGRCHSPSKCVKDDNHNQQKGSSLRLPHRKNCRSSSTLVCQRREQEKTSLLKSTKGGQAQQQKAVCESSKQSPSQAECISPVAHGKASCSRTNPPSDNESSPCPSKGHKFKGSSSSSSCSPLSSPSSAVSSPCKSGGHKRGSRSQQAAQTHKLCSGWSSHSNSPSRLSPHPPTVPKSKESPRGARPQTHSTRSASPSVVADCGSERVQSVHNKNKFSGSKNMCHKTSKTKTKPGALGDPPSSVLSQAQAAVCTLPSLDSVHSLPDLSDYTIGDSDHGKNKLLSTFCRAECKSECICDTNRGGTQTESYSPIRDTSPRLLHKRQCQASPEENNVSCKSKRRRMASGDRNPLTSLSENGRGADSQDSVRRDSTMTRPVVLLSDEDLEKRVMGLQEELSAVYHGKLPSQRHQAYMLGGRARRLLDHTDQLQHFQEGQEDIVMDVLLKMFTRNFKDLDYLIRVMLPEALSRILLQLAPQS